MAEKYVCKVKCYYRARLWTPGEILTKQKPDEKVPSHFAKLGTPGAAAKAPQAPDEPKTFSEMQQQPAGVASQPTGMEPPAAPQEPSEPAPDAATGQEPAAPASSEGTGQAPDDSMFE